MKKFWTNGFFLIFLLVLVLGSFHYHNDIPLERLKKKYAYSDSRFDSIGDLLVHYRVVGEGPDLLLLHGTASSLHTWESCTEEWAKSFRVISVDIPGFGLTGPDPNGDYSMAAYVDFIDQFAYHLQLDSFALAGNSLGGCIAWQYSLEYPDQVHQLILIDASGFSNDKPTPLSFKLARNNITAPLLKIFTPKSLIRRSLEDVYADDQKVTDALLERYFDMALRAGNRQAFIDRVRTKHSDHTHLLPQIDIPTLIIWGKEDTWIPVEHAAQFAAAIPNASVFLLDGVGHVPMEEAPAQVTPLVTSFLTD